MTLLEKAIEISTKAHKGQKDKTGKDYINHPMTVASMVNEDNEKIVAYLHDVVEDANITLADLKEVWFDNDVIEAIDAITKRDGENYEDYIYRVSHNKIAKQVKIADMTHNSDITRFDNPSQKDIERCEKYKKKLKSLSSM